MNISMLIFAIFFVIGVIIKLFQNYIRRKKYSNRKRIFSTKDLLNILFNVALFTAGMTSILNSLGYNYDFVGGELIMSQSLLNFVAGVLFSWFSIRNVFAGGKM